MSKHYERGGDGIRSPYARPVRVAGRRGRPQEGVCQGWYTGALRAAADLETAKYGTLPGVANDAAMNYLMAGDTARAFEWFERRTRCATPNLPYLNAYPLLIRCAPTRASSPSCAGSACRIAAEPAPPRRVPHLRRPVRPGRQGLDEAREGLVLRAQVLEHRAHFLLGLAVDLEVVVRFEAVAGGEAVLAHHQHGRGVGGLQREEQVHQDEGVGIPNDASRP